MARRAALATAAVALVVFVALLIAVSVGLLGTGSFDARADASAHTAVLDHRDLLTSARWLTHLGDPVVVDAITVIAAAVLWLLRRPRAALYVVAVRLTALVVESLVKVLVARPRPSLPNPVDHATGYSFPSGHAAGTASIYLPLAVVACAMLRGPVARSIVFGVAVLICVVVAATRVLLGVHYPSDVIGGLAVGVCATAAFLALGRSRSQEPTAKRLP
jgi:membrane-associated phospholipid phosphatase